MKPRNSSVSLSDRLVWQSASLLLAYPDGGVADRLDTVDRLLGHVRGLPAGLLGRTAAALRTREPMRVAVDYVETFDVDALRVVAVHPAGARVQCARRLPVPPLHRVPQP